jgi:hypothetical protein
MPSWKWLRAMIEHEAHHRGQLYLMLRLCGVLTPAIFGMTSEEVRATANAGVSAASATVNPAPHAPKITNAARFLNHPARVMTTPAFWSAA